MLAIVLSATAVLGCFLIPKVYIMVSNKWKEYHMSSADAASQAKGSVRISVISIYDVQKEKIDSGLPSSISFT